jgi:hypothetical protein
MISVSSWEDGLKRMPTPECTGPVQGNSVLHGVLCLLRSMLFACRGINRHETAWMVSGKAPAKTR